MATNDREATSILVRCVMSDDVLVNLYDTGVDRAPICPACGVTMLPAHLSNVIDSEFVCDNDECEAFGGGY